MQIKHVKTCFYYICLFDHELLLDADLKYAHYNVYIRRRITPDQQVVLKPNFRITDVNLYEGEKYRQFLITLLGGHTKNIKSNDKTITHCKTIRFLSFLFYL